MLARDLSAPSGAGKHAKWLMRCRCGIEGSTTSANLLCGASRSCGCLQSEGVTQRSTRHGLYYTKAHQGWFSAKKRGLKHKATPPWADQEKIKAIYRGRPPGHHVDHIVPLVSRVVCGLHCEANLQYLPAKENMRKKNKFEVGA